MVGGDDPPRTSWDLRDYALLNRSLIVMAFGSSNVVLAFEGLRSRLFVFPSHICRIASGVIYVMWPVVITHIAFLSCAVCGACMQWFSFQSFQSCLSCLVQKTWAQWLEPSSITHVKFWCHRISHTQAWEEEVCRAMWRHDYRQSSRMLTSKDKSNRNDVSWKFTLRKYSMYYCLRCGPPGNYLWLQI